MGSCHRCKVQIISGNVSDLTPEEKSALSERELRQNYRLACLVYPGSNVKVHVPPYHPDTPAVRQIWAEYHDRVTLMDQQFAALLEQLEDDGLAGILRSPGSPEKWVDRMVAEANRRGGLDNITALVVRIDEVDVPAPDPVTTQDTPAARRD